jgi:ferredoxin
MITVEVAGTRIEVETGTTMQQICDTYETPVVFGCRAAECGACLIHVVNGAENLSPMGPDEQDVLHVLAKAGNCRLACQCIVLGPVSIEVAD